MDDGMNELACPDCGSMVAVVHDSEPAFRKITCEYCGLTLPTHQLTWVRTLGDLLR